MDPASIIAGILRAPHGREAAADIAGVGALGAAAMPDQAQAADLSPTGIARALREAK